jgi:hypothetical protein
MHCPILEEGLKSNGSPTEVGVSLPTVRARGRQKNSVVGVLGPGLPAAEVGAVENPGEWSEPYELLYEWP